MSNLTVRGNTSGTGTIILESPNTNTNRTITLPDATATLATTADLSTINTALQFISSATINNVATVDFTGFDASKYSDYVFSLDNVIPVTDDGALFMRMSTDGGSTFLTSYVWNRLTVNASSTAIAAERNASPGANILLAENVGSDTNEFGISGEVRVFGPDLVARTNFTSLLSMTNSAADPVVILGSGQNRTTSAVNAVRFYFFSGNFESGVITMYGVRKS